MGEGQGEGRAETTARIQRRLSVSVYPSPRPDTAGCAAGVAYAPGACLRWTAPGGRGSEQDAPEHVKHTFVVFDLDGTLIDGYAAIADALSFAMERLGVPPLPLEKVRRMVGHGLEKLLEEAVGSARAAEGVRLFRQRYSEIAIEETELMPDVADVLAELSRRGHPMAVASNKPAVFSRRILEARGVASFFLAIGGPDPETPAKPDPAMLRRLMEIAGAGPGQTIVIGDMEVDSEFARAAGCRVVLVSGGSRSREELEKVDADALLAKLKDLPAWLEANSPTG
jgi:phosphoglycolate phosphatase